mmetsp:Transcript_10708/g.20830  ORF Transcript_10708/g.20830 Transcript_10708/m.20830 type:complete len:586 (-) Transcript_10708:69-1826(-)
MEDVVASLFERIDELEKTIARKDATIRILNEQLNASKSAPRQDLTEPLPKLEHSSSSRLAFQTDNLQFLSSLTGEEITLSFPESATSTATPTLTRQVTLRTHLRELLGDTRQFFEAKDKLKRELDNKIAGLEEEHRLRVDLANHQYTEDIRRIDEALKANLGEDSTSLEGKLCSSAGSRSIYVIKGFDRESFLITFDKLLDKNGIRLKEPVNFSKPLNELAGMSILDHDSATEFWNTLESNPEHIFVVSYQLIHVDDELMCCPVAIYPLGLSLNDYEIRFTKASSTITSVISKAENSVEVHFKAERYDDSCGFVSTSLVDVFLSEVSPHIVNLIHLHIEDTSSEIAIDTAYILPDQQWRDYAEFSLDVQGRPLRYKVIVKEGKVLAVLYNTGEGPKELFFIQRIIENGSLLKIGTSFARVIGIPTGLVVRDWKGLDDDIESVYVSQTPASFCKSRHIEDLPGLVDVEIFAENGALLPHTRRLSVPVCSTETLKPSDLALLERLYEQQLSAKKGSLETALAELSAFIEQFRARQVESTPETLKRLRELDQIVRDGLDASQRSEHAGLLRETEKALRIIATDVRFRS